MIAFWLLRRFNISRVVGSETAGRMILDKLAGITVSRNSVPATVNPVATGKGCESVTPEERLKTHL